MPPQGVQAVSNRHASSFSRSWTESTGCQIQQLVKKLTTLSQNKQVESVIYGSI